MFQPLAPKNGIPGNYHTHTTYCDGRHSAEEMIQQAIQLGCPEIGFTGHSYTWFDVRYCMSREGTEQYKAEINALKKKYAGQISILLGVEQDYYSEQPTDGYDFVIGSVHYVQRKGDFLAVDYGPGEHQAGLVRDYYGGDYMAFAEDYYATVGDLWNRTHCDMIGHFDVITKFNEGNCLFDTNDPRYIAAAEGALAKLFKTPVAFEINHGAMARGLRTVPYPEARYVDQIRAAGKMLVPTTDCHKKELLLYGIV